MRSAPGQAQLVRGTVRDAASGAPLAGVIVALYRGTGGATDAERLSATLTDADGGYALTPNDTGRFVVTAKRIGVRRFQSPAIALARGQTHRLDITLEGVRFDLPVVTVSGATPCNTRTADRARIAALWEEARTALTASELSLRERLFRATITRYHRLLEPRALAVRSESREVRRSVTEHAFESFPVESLATHGYARTLPDGVIEYFAPDERVLLSSAFVRDHCFALARNGGNGEVGITFAPARTRRLTDIEGTIWLDARSYELRRVTFRYTNFPMPVRDPRVGARCALPDSRAGPGMCRAGSCACRRSRCNATSREQPAPGAWSPIVRSSPASPRTAGMCSPTKRASRHAWRNSAGASSTAPGAPPLVGRVSRWRGWTARPSCSAMARSDPRRPRGELYPLGGA
ncbi:MAG: carboxypeptidase regulatory-like domain-containing protein [Gemmatimonadetes bacterium]|nr:carboxypeptidase regulatory-like domain-containing protein [Gemmatimonadota bacterium]